MRKALSLLLLLATRSLATDAVSAIDPSDDFAPGLFMIAVIAICIALLLVGIGIVAAAIMAASAAVLVTLGIVSSAVLVGIARKRLSSGLRVLHYQLFAIAAVPAGVGFLWLVTYLAGSDCQPGFILTAGSLAGVTGGLLLAFIFDCLARVIYRRFVAPTGPIASGNGPGS